MRKKIAYIVIGLLSFYTSIWAGIRNYQCETCDSYFKRIQHLRRHKLIHTGEKKFACKHPGCLKAFARQDTLNRHRLHHDRISRIRSLLIKRPNCLSIQTLLNPEKPTCLHIKNLLNPK